MFDLPAYLARIGLRGRPDLHAIHRAHTRTIPFENLDPARGIAVSLEPSDVHRKLIQRRRGGYCFEHNLLLAGALRALGHDVTPMLARVGPRGTERPRTHLLLRVDDGRGVWHADVGFGRGTLPVPIPFGPGDEHDEGGWRFRVIADGGELVLRTHDGEAWVDGYTFVPEPAPMIDIETSSWFAATHPSSRFVRGLTAARFTADGRAISLSDWSGELVFTEVSPPAHRVVTPVAAAEVGALLAERFGLHGFALDDDGRLVGP